MGRDTHLHRADRLFHVRLRETKLGKTFENGMNLFDRQRNRLRELLHGGGLREKCQQFPLSH